MKKVAPNPCSASTGATLVRWDWLPSSNESSTSRSGIGCNGVVRLVAGGAVMVEAAGLARAVELLERDELLAAGGGGVAAARMEVAAGRPRSRAGDGAGDGAQRGAALRVVRVRGEQRLRVRM